MSSSVLLHVWALMKAGFKSRNVFINFNYEKGDRLRDESNFVE